MIPLPPSTPLVRAVIAGVLVAAFVLLVWVFWPPAIPAEVKILEEQAAAEKARANQEAANAAEWKAKSEAAMQRNALLEGELRETLEQIPAVRERRRAARTATRARVAEVARTPDADAGRVLVEQHDRTRAAIERFRAGSGNDGDANGSAGPAHP